MGSTCCKTVVGLQPGRISNTPRTVQRKINVVPMPTGLNRSREESLDQETEHLINSRAMYEVSTLNCTKNNPKNELESSGYSSGTKATGSDTPIFDDKQSSENPCDQSSDIWSNNTDDLAQHTCDDESSRQFECCDDSDNHVESEEKNGLNQQEKDRLLMNFTYLKCQLDPVFLLDYFIENNIFTDDQAEQIKLAGCRRDQVDLFLRTLLMCRSCSAYRVLMTSLDKIHCKHIRTRLESESTKMYLPDDINLTLRKAQETLSKRRKAIVAQLEDPIIIAEYFVVHREFSLDEYELIFNEKTRKGRAEKLLDTVLERNHIQRSYIILSHALIKEGYTTLKENQEEQEETNAKELDDNSTVYELVSHGNTAVDSSSEVEEDDVIRITVNVDASTKLKHKKEKRIVSKANKYKIKLTLNNKLLCDTECLISDTEKGSIVIWIKGSRKGAIQRLLKAGTKESVSKLLRMIFSHPDILKEIHATATQLQVKVELIPEQRKAIKDKITGPKEIIVSNFSFLVEELDAVCFLYLDIFTKEEKESILAERVSSRAECTKLMLNFTLAKTEEEQLKFLHELQEKKRFVWNHIHTTERTESFDDDVLMTDYKHFVENMSPSVIVGHCVERGVLNTTLLYNTSFTGEHRETWAQIIMQEILLQDYRKRNEFLRILTSLNQIPPQISPLLKETAVEGPPTVSTDVRMIFEGTYRPVGSKEKDTQVGSKETDAQRGLSENTKDSFRDDESGYQSLSFRERRSPHWNNPEWSEENGSYDYNSLNDLSRSEEVLQETPIFRRASTMERDIPMQKKSKLPPIAHYHKRSRIPRSRSLPPRPLLPLSGVTPTESEEELQMNLPGILNEQKQSIEALSVSPFIQKKIKEQETKKCIEKYDAKIEKLPHNYNYVTDIECGCFPMKK
ncbi:uncharacterized protein LOC128557905 [Mercenaria mercenaria]|uniref:uncharacterized protein LOC128557905 n=1 Tax=Mercenaria mercenaria TaxID=6596 RepID=UPI00234FA871|nr:uncharacterized protein LOC128557905 [Mercenaria mercenaria]